MHAFKLVLKSRDCVQIIFPFERTYFFNNISIPFALIDSDIPFNVFNMTIIFVIFDKMMIFEVVFI